MNKIIAHNPCRVFQGPTCLIRHLLHRINKNVSYPSSYSFKTESKMWQSYGFGLKTVGRPSVAVRDILEHKTTLDCERTSLLISYFLLLSKIGDKAFDDYFSEGLRITASMNFTKIPRALDKYFRLVQVPSFQHLKVGDWLYFENSPSYLEHNPGGPASGEHVICSSTNPLRFVGLLDKSLPLSYEQWLDVLYANSEGIEYGDIKGVYKRDGSMLVKRIIVEA